MLYYAVVCSDGPDDVGFDFLYGDECLLFVTESEAKAQARRLSSDVVGFSYHVETWTKADVEYWALWLDNSDIEL